ncbi:hypothetical protein GCM10011519_15420 [Marmoricola endophyticus]|uniref:Laminin G domain-containing protein n=1 Tax=Marmoricola endophyticus TaxID=2040280 RepID=A0A917F1A8_9ACTN|nr:LamG domain-containing protein [Marmoricola endophyticus]GGF42483.1 hypothetical protein GCM10011519_15420 [Marmoricola endophyticus]
MTRRGRTLAAAGAVLAGLVLLLLGTPTSLGAYSSKVTNTQNTAASGSWASSCAPADVLGAARADSAYFFYQLNEASGTRAADTGGNNLSGTYTRFGVSYRDSAAPCGQRDSDRAVSFDGGSGYLTGAQIAGDIPTSLSLEVWFKTTTGQGGKLVGVGNQSTGASGVYDRHLFMSNDGRLSFGTYDGGAHVITGSRSYNDGVWHQAVATLTPSGSLKGMRLYVDGKVVASNTSWTKGEPVSNGYVRIGYDNLGGWSAVGDSGPPNSYYFKGSMAYVSGYGTALSPARVQAHYDAGS